MSVAVYTTAEVAALLGMTCQTVRKYAESGHLPKPILKAGGTFRWSRAEIDSYLKTKTQSKS